MTRPWSPGLLLVALLLLPGPTRAQDDGASAARGIGPLLTDEPSAPPATPARGGGFVQHLREAIALNEARRAGYAARTGGVSRRVSDRLLRGERLTIPLAWLIDRWAARYNRDGVGIVRDDFVPMAGAAPADAPPRHRGRASTAQLDEVRRLLGAYRRRVGRALPARDYEGLARDTATTLDAVEALEERWGCHFAMTRHLLEQVGYAAVRAIEHARASGGRTHRLTSAFVRLLARPLGAGVELDAAAQRAHERGVGLLVNDLPPIPFRAALDALR